VTDIAHALIPMVCGSHVAAALMCLCVYEGGLILQKQLLNYTFKRKIADVTAAEICVRRTVHAPVEALVWNAALKWTWLEVLPAYHHHHHRHHHHHHHHRHHHNLDL
jgi:hypothetical protein